VPLSRHASPLRQSQVVPAAGLPPLKTHHAKHARTRRTERQEVEPRSLIKVRAHYEYEPGGRCAALERPVARNHLEAISPWRQIVIIGGPATCRSHESFIDAVQLVSKGHALRSAEL